MHTDVALSIQFFARSKNKTTAEQTDFASVANGAVWQCVCECGLIEIQIVWISLIAICFFFFG